MVPEADGARIKTYQIEDNVKTVVDRPGWAQYYTFGRNRVAFSEKPMDMFSYPIPNGNERAEVLFDFDDSNNNYVLRRSIRFV